MVTASPPSSAVITGGDRNLSLPRRVVQLDFIRGLAILAVLEYHALSVPVQNSWAQAAEYTGKRLGWMGVDLFFVLSGFLIGGLLVQELIRSGNIQIGRFLVRRMFKIWPAYYLFIAVQAVFGRYPLKSFLWQNASNVQNYTDSALTFTWSLAVEEHFYLVLPFLLGFLYRSQRLRPYLVPILSAICLLVLAGRIFIVYFLHDDHIYVRTHTRLDSLLFGVLISYAFYIHHEQFDRVMQWRPLLLAAAMAGLTFAYVQGRESHLMESVGYTCNYLALGSLLVLVYSYDGYLTRTLPYRAIAKVGLYSYGIYLWHLAVFKPLAKLTSHLPAGIQWGGLLLAQYAAAIILGVVMTKLIEFPMLRIRDRLVPRGQVQLPLLHDFTLDEIESRAGVRRRTPALSLWANFFRCTRN